MWRMCVNWRHEQEIEEHSYGTSGDQVHETNCESEDIGLYPEIAKKYETIDKFNRGTYCVDDVYGFVVLVSCFDNTTNHNNDPSEHTEKHKQERERKDLCFTLFTFISQLIHEIFLWTF